MAPVRPARAATIRWFWEEWAQNTLDEFFAQATAYDLVLSIDAGGQLALTQSEARAGGPFPRAVRQALRQMDFRAEPWFAQALESGTARIDQHRSQLLPRVDRPQVEADQFHVGLAQRVEGEQGQPVGVVLLLMNWSPIQDLVDTYGIRRLGTGPAGEGASVGEDIYKSSYGWVWRSDADTIIAHLDRNLYGKRVSQPPIELAPMSEAARGAEWGMYPDYSFRGERKKAAFKHCRSPQEGGFGWVVGVGVNNRDIYGPVQRLLKLLATVSLVALVAGVAWTFHVARRATRPILELEQHTRRIAEGDLDTRIQLDRRDEIGDLAEAFNRMTAELKQKREQLVQAEKDAAWREMARQVAHEIKNPLTPHLALGEFAGACSQGGTRGLRRLARAHLGADPASGTGHARDRPRLPRLRRAAPRRRAV